MIVVFTGDFCAANDMLRTTPDPRLIRLPEYYAADKRIVNLEQAVSSREPRTNKISIHADGRALPFFEALKIDIGVLANNHILDHGLEGIGDTAEALRCLGKEVVGAGRNLIEARKPVYIDRHTAILAYCGHHQYYPLTVSIADECTPGAAPIDEEFIRADLEALPEDVKAVLELHCGRENFMMVPGHVLSLFKRLLKHPKVALVIGHHPHIPQGWIRENGKYAFLSLGNFLFPNWYFMAKQVIGFPESPPTCPETWRLGPVPCTTRKTWTEENRRALLVTFDTETGKVSRTWGKQRRNEPVVDPMPGTEARSIERRMEFRSWTYRWPIGIYSFFASIDNSVENLIFRLEKKIVYWLLKWKWIPKRAPFTGTIS